MTTTCKYDGSARSDDLRKPCPECGSTNSFFGIYLRPDESRGSWTGFWIALSTLILVILGTILMRIVLGNQIMSSLFYASSIM
jgi:hypothetical protein